MKNLRDALMTIMLIWAWATPSLAEVKAKATIDFKNSTTISMRVTVERSDGTKTRTHLVSPGDSFTSIFRFHKCNTEKNRVYRITDEDDKNIFADGEIHLELGSKCSVSTGELSCGDNDLKDKWEVACQFGTNTIELRPNT